MYVLSPYLLVHLSITTPIILPCPLSPVVLPMLQDTNVMYVYLHYISAPEFTQALIITVISNLEAEKRRRCLRVVSWFRLGV